MNATSESASSNQDKQMPNSDQPCEVNAQVLSEKPTMKRVGVRLWYFLRRTPVFSSLVLSTLTIIVATIPTWDVYMWWGYFRLFPVVDVYEICKVWSEQGFGHVPWFPDSCFG